MKQKLKIELKEKNVEKKIEHMKFIKNCIGMKDNQNC
jgi:hypothetical protein